MLLNYSVGEDSWESLGQQGDPTSPSWRKSVLNIHWKPDAEAETPILWPPDVKIWLIGKDPDAGKDRGQEEGDDRGWNDWMASLTWWTWVWVSSESWWWTGKPGTLQSKESDTTEWLNWTDWKIEPWHSYLALISIKVSSFSYSSFKIVMQPKFKESLINTPFDLQSTYTSMTKNYRMYEQKGI